MAQPTIKNIWAQNTSNKLEFTEEEVANGIVEKSEVVSNQLNGVFNRSETFIDLLQRANAWNAGKTYNTGDMCFVAVNFRKSCDTSGKRYVMIFISNVDNNTAEPLIRKSATTFTLNNDLVVPLYTITQNNDTTALSSYTNSTYWTASDLTMGDLTNATQLKVCDDATIKGNATIDGNLTVGGTNKTTIDPNGNITTGNVIASNFSSYTPNINATVNTPSYSADASSKDIINVEWFYKHNRNKLSIIANEWEVITDVFNGTTRWTDYDYIYVLAKGTGGASRGFMFAPLQIFLKAWQQGDTNIYSILGLCILKINASAATDEYSNPFSIENGTIECVAFRKK